MSSQRLPQTVLVVDDVSLDRAIVSDIVRREGAEVIEASSSAEAMTVLAKTRPSVVVMDLHMPGEPGDLCCGVIKSNTQMADLPVIITTSARSEAEVRRALFAGAEDFLPKPVVEAQLAAKLAAVREGLRRRGTIPQAAAGATVLVADDDGIVRTLLARTLEGYGYRVLLAETGLEALQLMHQSRPAPELLIIDLFMPGVGGIELIRKIRETPVWSHLPVVVVSAVRRDASILAELSRIGVQDLIDKDEALLETIIKRSGELLFRGANGREGQRVDFFRVCEFRRRADEPWMSGFITNLAKNGGVFIRTLTSAPADALIDVRFDLAGEGSLLVAKAAVVWAQEYEARPGRGTCGMGVRLLDLSEESRRAIAAVV